MTTTLDPTALRAQPIHSGRATRGRSAPVFLLYSHDGFGIGHVQRNLAIARAITRIAPGANVVLLAGVVPPTTCLSEGIDIIKLPSIRKTGHGQWGPDRLNLGVASIRRLRQRLISETVSLLDPDVVLVDYLPSGAWGELAQVIEALHRRENGTRLVLGLRDVLDSRRSVTRHWWQAGIYDFIASNYDRILVYGDEDIFATARHYGLAGEQFPDVHYCGYVSNAESVCDQDEIRRSLGMTAGEKLVTVTVGGGRDAFDILRCAVDAVQALSRHQSLRGVLLAGPFVDKAKLDELRSHAQRAKVTCVPYTADPVGYVAAADAVVSMGGYNTLCEALRHRRKVLVIPRSGPSMEQRIRAGLFERLGLVRTLNPDGLTSGHLVRALRDMLSDRAPHRALPIDDGERAARHLLELANRGTRANRSPTRLEPDPDTSDFAAVETVSARSA